jgi:hypothetical protein
MTDEQIEAGIAMIKAMLEARSSVYDVAVALTGRKATACRKPETETPWRIAFDRRRRRPSDSRSGHCGHRANKSTPCET